MVWRDLCYVVSLLWVRGGAKLWTYLALGARHALVARVLCLAWWTLAPHGNGNAGVGEYQHQQRHDELQREQGQRVVIILSTLWPNLAANVSDDGPGMAQPGHTMMMEQWQERSERRMLRACNKMERTQKRNAKYCISSICSRPEELGSSGWGEGE